MNKQERQFKILGLIVEQYVKTGQPVSSGALIKQYKLTESPATIRNDMATLEKEGYIEKPHTSGGRIPTSKGYEIYVELGNSNPNSVKEIKKQLKELFEDRTKSIDEVLELSLDLINESTSSISISKKSLSEVKLQDLKAYKITDEQAMIIAVFSNGTVNNVNVDLANINFDDFSTAIHIFADRLQGINAGKLEETALGLKNVLEDQVKALEDQYQEFIGVIFKRILASEYDTKGTSNIVVRGIEAETVQKLLTSVQDNSIWELLSKSKNVEKNSTKVTVDLGETGLQKISAISKTFQIGGVDRDVAVIGTTDQAYNDIIDVLEFIEEEVKKNLK